MSPRQSEENISPERPRVFQAVFNRENILALLLALLLIAIFIATASDSPLWVYQGF